MDEKEKKVNETHKKIEAGEEIFETEEIEIEEMAIDGICGVY